MRLAAVIALLSALALAPSLAAERQAGQCAADPRPQVGMALSELRRCWPQFGMFALAAELRAVDGSVVSLYELRWPYSDFSMPHRQIIGVGAIYIHDGRVVSWEK